jgi:SAM-dependent methyltransferase
VKRCLRCEATFSGSGWACPACGWSPQAEGGRLVFVPDGASGRNGFDPTSFEHLPGVEERSFWFRSRNQLIVWLLGRYFPRFRSFLEVGCGTGYVLQGVQRAFPNAEIAGAELFGEGLAHAEQRAPEADLYEFDARNIPFEEEFDVVGAFDMLEHVDDDDQALRELHRASRPGGGIVVTVPQHPWLWSEVDVFSHHCRRYRSGELRAKLEHAGFEVLRTTSFVSLLLPLMALSRLRQRRLESFDPLDEYRHPPFVDSAFAWAMTLERGLIRRGLSLPAGGSLAAVGRRR